MANKPTGRKQPNGANPQTNAASCNLRDLENEHPGRWVWKRVPKQVDINFSRVSPSFISSFSGQFQVNLNVSFRFGGTGLAGRQGWVGVKIRSISGIFQVFRVSSGVPDEGLCAGLFQASFRVSHKVRGLLSRSFSPGSCQALFMSLSGLHPKRTQTTTQKGPKEFAQGPGPPKMDSERIRKTPDQAVGRETDPKTTLQHKSEVAKKSVSARPGPIL